MDSKNHPKPTHGKSRSSKVDIKDLLQIPDKRGQIVITRALRILTEMPEGCRVYLKPFGPGKILLQVIAEDDDIEKILEKHAEITSRQIEEGKYRQT